MNIGFIGAIVVLILLVGFVLYREWSRPENGKEKAKEFLDNIYNAIEAIICDYLDKLDINNFDNLIEVEKEIINEIMDTVWNLVTEKLAENSTDRLTKILIKKYLTREFVEQFVTEVFRQSTKAQKTYTEKYNGAILSAYKEAEELEEVTDTFNTEIENDDPVGFREVEDIDSGIVLGADGLPIQQELNPPTDEEKPIDPEDNSVEIL